MTVPRDAALTSSWRESSRSTGGQDCVEVAQTRDNCLVRDSKDPSGPRLAVSPRAWDAFTSSVRGNRVLRAGPRE